MLKKLRTEIRRWPLPAQAFAWPFYGLVHALSSFLGWALAEMTGQAKAKAKKAFAPLLWPVLAVFAVALLFAILGEQGFIALLQAVLGPVFAIVMVFFGLKLMFSSFMPRKRKK